MNIKSIIDAVFPVGYACINCGKEIFDDELLLCDSCKKELPYLIGKLCLHCSEPITGKGKYCLHCKGKKFDCDKIVSPFKYDGLAKKFIVGLKYNNKKYYAQSLSNYMAMTFEKEFLPCDIVTCVPVCDKRLKERGYNQAEILGKYFAKAINKPFYPNILKRVKETPTQTKLTFTERQKNMVDAFKVIEKNITADKVIVIIDDVYTTGATIKACAVKLKQAGAKAVYAVTAGHTILKKEENKTKQKSKNKSVPL